MFKLNEWKILITLGLLQIANPILAELAEVGFDCTTEKDCSYFKTENINSRCVENTCHCYNNKTFANTKCQPHKIHASNIIGGFCPCSLPHAECNHLDNLCYCETNYIPTIDKRRCIPEEVPLGELCEIEKQCQALNVFSHCANDTRSCTCNNSFYQNNSTCMAQTKLQSKCADGMNCTKPGPNMICLPDINECVCEAGYVSSNNSNECMPERRYKEECHDTLQCYAVMGPGAKCLKGKCHCEEEYELVKKNNTEDMICKPLVVIGQYCRMDKHCRNERETNEGQLMECNRGECVCRFGIKNEQPCSLSSATNVIASKISLWFVLIVNTFLIYVKRG